VKWLALLACLLITAPATAIVDPPPKDESVPDLVKQYIFLPCDAMTESWHFIYNELQIITSRYQKCVAFYVNEEGKGHESTEYPQLLCLYVRMQWQYMYEHIKSLEKAHELTCNDNNEKKNPEYEIQF
jgi:hypothetical protein